MRECFLKAQHISCQPRQSFDSARRVSYYEKENIKWSQSRKVYKFLSISERFIDFFLFTMMRRKWIKQTKNNSSEILRVFCVHIPSSNVSFPLIVVTITSFIVVRRWWAWIVFCDTLVTRYFIHLHERKNSQNNKTICLCFYVSVSSAWVSCEWKYFCLWNNEDSLLFCRSLYSF